MSKKQTKLKCDLWLGYLIIFASFGIFGETEIWSWQMWCEVIGVAIGGTVLIQHGKNCRQQRRERYKDTGDFRDPQNFESQNEYFGRK